MKLVTPIGFIALLALIVYFLIYFIKPSYKAKMISTTYIWEESLKYRKNRNRTSKLRNIILVILEILIILLSTFILVTPLVNTKNISLNEQNVIVVDASGNMQAETPDGVTRFDRAISQIKEFSSKSVDQKKPVTIIYSGSEAKYVVQQEEDKTTINNKLDELICSYGTGDIKSAMELVNEYVGKNALADVYYYTATTYNDTKDVKIVDMKHPEEWNMSIVDVKAENIENFYAFEVELMSYGIDTYVNVDVEIKGVNDEEKTIKASKRVDCINGVLNKVRFENLKVYAFDSIKVTISLDGESKDSFIEDNTFILNGGRKHNINIQYVSKAHNNFFDGITRVLRNNFKDVWNINVSEPEELSDAKYKGFDLYIFEHTMPTTLPNDGVVLLVNPDKIPEKVDVELGAEVIGNFTMGGGVNHDLVKYMNMRNIEATVYKPLILGDGYTSLINCNGESVYAVNEEEKVAILSLNPNRSNLPIILDFPILITNLFKYFIPNTIDKSVYEVGEEIQINARGTAVELKNQENIQALTVPTNIKLDKNGEYSISQKLENNKKITDKLFIKIPELESNINRVVKDSENIFNINRPSDAKQDIYVYLAGFVLLFVCLERLLYSRENV